MELKASVPGFILLFRMGDFYELFFDDAARASAALDIALTTRGSHNGAPIPMAGGFLVAVADQVEEPAAARSRGAKIVDRAITKRITPGTLIDDALLAPRIANYLMSISAPAPPSPAAPPSMCSLAWIDVSTGEWFLDRTSPDLLPADLARLAPAEIVLDPQLPHLLDVLRPALEPYYVNTHPPAPPAAAAADCASLAAARAALDAAPFAPHHTAAGNLLLDVVAGTHPGATPLLHPPRLCARDSMLSMDAATRASLELTSSSAAVAPPDVTEASEPASAVPVHALARKPGPTLLSLIDKTVTGPGGRMLGSWLASPLTSLPDIAARHDAVEAYVTAPATVKDVRHILRGTGDLSRSLQRLCMAKGSPRDLGVVSRSLAKAAELVALDAPSPPVPPSVVAATSGLAATLGSALADTLPISLADLSGLSSGAAVVAAGFSAELDRKRAARDDGAALVAELETKYRDATGLAALKIRHNSVLGYYIQVPATRKERMDEFAPDIFHIQSMAASHRYASAELKDLERELAAAASDAVLLETKLFDELVQAALAAAPALFDLSEALAELDVTSALAKLAADHGFVRPDMTPDPRILDIVGGRHPLVELSGSGRGTFTPNDCAFDGATSLHLITGPNMGGKSTFLRQNALIVILAQMGSFVPAEAATIGVVDAVYSRVGAADDLAGDRSTFMVEMVEAAAIVKSATPASLVLMDEIGRGTATYDGLALAWAIVEHLALAPRARTLFATHYHELTKLGEALPNVSNYAMDVRELANNLLFLYKVVPGAASKSYGLHVARLAGMPEPVLDRAAEVLDALERAADPPPPQSAAQ
ncbi:DNA mismatch repair protein MutS [Thecamonas trahens ATCC 50062]|uniref:DNA mismatch repair protein MutS n=1 Tax=Thecamonas trahens ATCC 50062 TaxID=461836 RepID=A0A0L0D4E3_THETB|nr:DNA mismatch repair protein MutS [Thecamonas trahens ATCC 50062]KNC46976.1 DNA mismatch repair protein MutS [Thecamonas trahens ATCC 50062]|eukprot:XP_013760247.1 DNA mismatch repair protein MutS [Thecamonas trahens ATCC 50062]